MDHFDIDAEGKAAKKTWELKEALRRHTASKEFWEVLMSGMVDVTGALCAFVSRRIPKEKYSKGNNPTEFESMLAHAFYYDDRKGPPRIHQHQEYEADHQLTQEKVVLIPHSLNNLYPKMSTLVSMSPVTTEAYLAIPLWQGDICFAQMGLLWTKDGLQKKPPLSWGYLTTFLLGLEEAVQKRLATDISTPHPDIAPHTPKFSLRSKIPQAGVPHCCKISLKPYARNVSHELRTPMQGVIGTLDLLHGSILELSNLCTPQPSSIIESMLQNVELAQG